MPTVEIIAVSARAVPALPEYRRFAWRGSTELISDCALFQSVLDRLSGAIVHLGDRSDHPEYPSWFCGHIIKNRTTDEDWHKFQFDDDARGEIADLLQQMHEASPDRYVVFLTDFQFGPDEPLEVEFESLAEFWERHDSRKLRHNTLYHIGSRKSSHNKSAAMNRRPAGQADNSDNLRAIVAADRAFPAAIADLDIKTASHTMNSQRISLADILGPWVEPDWQSGLIERCRKVWNTPLPELTNEQLATLLRQRFAVEHLLPIAQQRVRDGFDDDTELSDGELERAIEHASTAA